MRKEKKHSHLLLDDIVEILSSLVEITRQHVHNHLSASVIYQWRRQNAEKSYAQQMETAGSSSDSHQLRPFSKWEFLLKGRNPVPPTGEWLQYETIRRWSLTTV